MSEEKEELKRAKEILNKEVGRIMEFERLSQNPDFQIFRKELIDDKIDVLFDLLEEASDANLGRIRGQIEALRGITKAFDFVISRKEDVNKRLRELNN